MTYAVGVPLNKQSKHRLTRHARGSVSVSSSPGLSQISPYLNFDPSYLGTTQPEFIFPEGAAKQRGRFEVAFSQIGGEPGRAAPPDGSYRVNLTAVI